MATDTTTTTPELPPFLVPQDLLQSVPAGVMVVDQGRRLVFVNRWLCDRVGRPASLLLGSSIDDLLTEDHRAETARALSSLFATGQPAGWQASIGLTGDARSAAFTATPIYRDGAVIAAQVNCVETPATSELAVIHDLEQRIASFPDRRDLPSRIAALIQQRFGYSDVWVFVRDQNRAVLKLEAAVPPGIGRIERTVALETETSQASTVSWVAHHGRPLLIDDIRQDTFYQASWDDGSELAIPIAVGDEVLGVLDVHQAGIKALRESDLFILESFSSRIAVTIENAQLRNEVVQRLAQAHTLELLAQQVSSSLDLPVVLDSIVTILRQVLGCRGANIFLLDEDREWLTMRESSGIKPYWQREARMRLGEGITGRVAQDALPLYIADAQEDPDFIVFDPEVRSLLVVPLSFKGQVIGTLNVDDSKPEAFAGDVGSLLSIVAVQAAAAIENAKLHTGLKERAEKLAQAHRELQESDRLKSEFVQNTSHELRTPLTYIKGYVELLLEGKLDPLTERQRDGLQIVSERTNRIVELVNEILTLQQVDRGELRFAAVSIEEVAQTSLRDAAATARQLSISLVKDFAPDLPLVWGDRARMDQVFSNLIGNALKFSPEGGTIIVRLQNDDGFVRADVIDQGIGIAQDQLSRIFERFFQVDGSSKRRFGGTGLGLAIVKEIVEAHGGTVTVESQVDIGSTFSFTVPCAPQE